jgi:F-type H+-transporting ATPase subunit alpha
LRLTYSQFEELEVYTRFGTRLDEKTIKTIERGDEYVSIEAVPIRSDAGS